MWDDGTYSALLVDLGSHLFQASYPPLRRALGLYKPSSKYYKTKGMRSLTCGCCLSSREFVFSIFCLYSNGVNPYEGLQIASALLLADAGISFRSFPSAELVAYVAQGKHARLLSS